MSKTYYAHTNYKNDERQTYEEHSNNVANRMQRSMKGIDVFDKDNDARLYVKDTGKNHDVGKCGDWEDTLDGKATGIDHRLLGAYSLYKNGMMAAAMCVLGHHGGLVSNTAFGAKMREIDSTQDTAPGVAGCDSGAVDIKSKIDKDIIRGYNVFEQMHLIRMLFSALVDADAIDTCKYMNCISDEDYFYDKYDTIETIVERIDETTNKYLNTDETKLSSLNKLRNTALRDYCNAGMADAKIVIGETPCGLGKTIASMGFASEAIKKSLDTKKPLSRIIYVSPFTSITAQTADVFRQLVGENNVIEHHSAIVEDEEDDLDYEKITEKYKKKRAIENWDAPIVVTTMVQFGESLMSNKVSKCRKLHNISNSVIIIDEVQKVPAGLMNPFMKSLDMLAKFNNCKIVLLSATQPQVEKYSIYYESDNMLRIHSNVTKELLYKETKRCQIKNIGKVTSDDLINRAVEEKNTLIIVDRKKTAQNLYHKLEKLNLETPIFCLERYQTQKHILENINEIKKLQAEGKSCIVVATSLVEAGVDLSFQYVYRAMTSLDSIIQAAGRCNREGGMPADQCYTYIFEADKNDTEMGTDVWYMPQSIEVSTTKDTYNECGEYNSLNAINTYFTRLYDPNRGTTDCDKWKIVRDIFYYKKGSQCYRDSNQIMPFELLAHDYKFIENDDKADVIVCNNVDLVDTYLSALYVGNQKVCRKMQKFAIGLSKKDIKKLEEVNLLITVDDSKIKVFRPELVDEYYDATGLQVPEKYHCER